MIWFYQYFCFKKTERTDDSCYILGYSISTQCFLYGSSDLFSFVIENYHEAIFSVVIVWWSMFCSLHLQIIKYHKSHSTIDLLHVMWTTSIYYIRYLPIASLRIWKILFGYPDYFSRKHFSYVYYRLSAKYERTISFLLFDFGTYVCVCVCVKKK